MPRRGGIGFSQADVDCSLRESNPNVIRPKENRDVMVGEDGMDLDGGEEGESKSDEQRKKDKSIIST